MLDCSAWRELIWCQPWHFSGLCLYHRQLYFQELHVGSLSTDQVEYSATDIFIKLWNSNRNNNSIPLKWPSWLISSSFLFFLEWQSCWSVSGVEACHSSVKLSSTEIDGSSHKSWSWCSCRSRFIKYCSKTVPTLTCCKWSIGCAWASLICVHKPTEMSLCVCAFSCALTKCQTQLVWKELVVTQSTSAE